MKRILIIARHEFVATVTRKAYLIAAVALPIVMAGSAALAAASLFGRASRESAARTGVLDRANVVNLELWADQTEKGLTSSTAMPDLANPEKLDSLFNKTNFVRYSDLDTALDDLRHDKIVVCYVIEPNYLETGHVTVYRSENSLGIPSSSQDELLNLLRTMVLNGKVIGQTRERALEPARFERKSVSADGQIRPEMGPLKEMATFFGPFLLCFFFILSVFQASSYLLQGIALERQNRVLEVMFSLTEPMELLAGKTIGLGAAGLLQAAVYAGFAAIALPVVGAGNLGLLALSLVYVLLGFLLVATFMTTTGVLISNSEQESQMMGVLWMLVVILPFPLLVGFGIDSTAARVMSFVPMTACQTMIARLTLSDPGAVDIVGSIASLIVGIYLAFRLAAKLFRASTLLYGKRLSVSEALRWLHES